MVAGVVVAELATWTFGWEALVAIGTMALALATGALALSTRNLARKTAEEVEHARRQVDASLEQVKVGQQQATTAQLSLDAAREQTRLAQLTLNAQIRPVLVDMTLSRDYGAKEEVIYYPGLKRRGKVGAVEVGNDHGAMISVPMRNAGAGLAMIRGIRLEVGEATPPPLVTIQPANVAPGEHTRVSFLAASDHPAFSAIQRAIAPGYGSFSVVVSYTDLAGQQMTLSRFDIHLSAGNWGVRQVHLQEPGNDEPFAGSAPTV